MPKEDLIPGEDAGRLYECDQVEWWDVARRVNPRITWEEFERDGQSVSGSSLSLYSNGSSSFVF